ncbi:MAG: signal peptidase II [Lachnospiraceae bacterium]|nr:signal peptidase II [Lachnospiraceae bacterium]
MSRETSRYRETDTERGHREQVQKAFRLTLAAEAVLTALLVILDQVTKLAAVSALKDREPFVLIPGVFQLQYLENRGAAFGLLQNARIFFLAVTLIALAAVIYVLVRLPLKRRYIVLRFLMVLIAAGAVGNMIDRVFLGYVRDFLYFSLIDFPIFNVADIYVTCATILLILLLLFYYKEEDDFAFLSPGGKKGKADD